MITERETVIKGKTAVLLEQESVRGRRALGGRKPVPLKSICKTQILWKVICQLTALWEPGATPSSFASSALLWSRSAQESRSFQSIAICSGLVWKVPALSTGTLWWSWCGCGSLCCRCSRLISGDSAVALSSVVGADSWVFVLICAAQSLPMSICWSWMPQSREIGKSRRKIPTVYCYCSRGCLCCLEPVSERL